MIKHAGIVCRFNAGVIACVGLLMARPAAALVVESGLTNNDESSLLAVYSDFPYWSNVGEVGTNGSGVYLGNGWVVSAAHVNTPGTDRAITLDGVKYDMNQVAVLDNPNVPGTLTSQADLKLFKLKNNLVLNLPGVFLASTRRTVGEEVVMIGTGFITTEPDGPAPFDIGTDRAKLWGQNKVNQVWDGIANTNDPMVKNILGRRVITFNTRFDQPSIGLPHEAQASPGDSGGGTFVLEEGAWKLAGVFHAVNGTTGRASYGDTTFITEIPLYADQINARIFNNGDVNRDFDINVTDIDLLFANFGPADPGSPFDLTLDGLVDQADADMLVQTILGSAFGDANLDGSVDGDDFRTLKDHLNTPGGWAQGNFNGDALVDIADYELFKQNFGFGTDSQNGAGLVIPEPAAGGVMILLGAALLRRRRDTADR